MDLLKVMNEKDIKISWLERNTSIPYTTLSDICYRGKKLGYFEVPILSELANALGMDMEDLYLSGDGEKDDRIEFDILKRIIEQRLKELGDLRFIIHTVKRGRIREYYNKGWLLDSLYLLAVLDYVCRINDIPLTDRYDDIREQKLPEPVYDDFTSVYSIIWKTDKLKTDAETRATPEFKRFNIMIKFR